MEKGINKIEKDLEVQDHASEPSVNNYFKEKYERLVQQNPDLFENVRRYKSDYYYFSINAIARMGVEGYKDSLKKRGRLDAAMEKRIKEAQDVISVLENIFRESRLNKAVSVFRRVSDETIQKIKECGGVFTDNGFVSTSYSLEDVKKIYKTHTIRIDLPEGTRVIDMPSALQQTKWKEAANWENELVIDKGYSYAITPSDSDEYELILKLKPESD